ncbi:helix-turn-helix domain-containing protein [Streptomyces sp. P38-E01]|uniref:Helix-turn-helix domain-containing protein n=1 Tax=Streptomyces tardus TaxID=2780544 RepID=A0A949N6D2_9ACTN|nr:helix-turn-helix transcriptional regulator [Streptomyces tardus]MBU7598942.1 helix-turn-helix domain-containing protein [Streptomyces tardus]
MAHGELFSVGQRVKWLRERRGMSQKTLGDFVGRTENWVYKIEHGRMPVDRLPVLIALCRALKCSMEDLTSGYVSGVTIGESEHEHVPAIRQALSLPTSILPVQVEGVSAEDFGLGVADAWTIYETQAHARYRDVGERLPTLLRQGHAALRDSNPADEPAVLRQLISLYSLHQIWLRRVGEPTLARIAADRGLALADNAEDPALLAAAAWSLSCVLTSSGDVADSYELVRQTIHQCRPDEAASAEHWSAFGALHLQGAVAAVRANKAPMGWDLYRGAQEAAVQVGSDLNAWHTCFGPTNVAMHEVHLMAEEGDPSEALRVADTIQVNPELPLERRTRYLIEVMNLNRIQRDDYATVHILGKLMKQSPEEIMFSPLVREAVAELLKREKPLWRDDLRAVARHIGLAA